jgi:hypothetical protein
MTVMSRSLSRMTGKETSGQGRTYIRPGRGVDSAQGSRSTRRLDVHIDELDGRIGEILVRVPVRGSPFRFPRARTRLGHLAVRPCQALMQRREEYRHPAATMFVQDAPFARRIAHADDADVLVLELHAVVPLVERDGIQRSKIDDAARLNRPVFRRRRL